MPLRQSAERQCRVRDMGHRLSDAKRTGWTAEVECDGQRWRNSYSATAVAGHTMPLVQLCPPHAGNAVVTTYSSGDKIQEHVRRQVLPASPTIKENMLLQP
jgi:hypothetical protein